MTKQSQFLISGVYSMVYKVVRGEVGSHGMPYGAAYLIVRGTVGGFLPTHFVSPS